MSRGRCREKCVKANSHCHVIRNKDEDKKFREKTCQRGILVYAQFDRHANENKGPLRVGESGAKRSREIRQM